MHDTHQQALKSHIEEAMQTLNFREREILKLRYGVYVHEGDVKSGKVAEAYQRFVKLSGK